MRLGLLLHDLLSWRSRSMPRHGVLNRRALRPLVPGITPAVVGGVLFHDARVTPPERLGVELVLDTEAATDARAWSQTEPVDAGGPHWSGATA